MVGAAVGFESRVVRHLRHADPAEGLGPASRARDVLTLAHTTREAIGRLYKVLPTALVAAACGRRCRARDLPSAVADVLGAAEGGRRQPRQRRPRRPSPSTASRVLEARDILVVGARTSSACATGTCCATTRARIEHLLQPAEAGRGLTDAGRPLEELLPHPRRQRARSSRWPRATACATRTELRPPLHRRRDASTRPSPPPASSSLARPAAHARPARRERHLARRGRAPRRHDYVDDHRGDRRRPASSATSRSS